jgi:glyoxylase-like metal-dependent hydrolase (beta-lactamase superfamily II)
MDNKIFWCGLALSILLAGCSDPEPAVTADKPARQSPSAAVTAPASTKRVYAPTGVEMVVQQVGPHSYYVQGQAGVATDNEGFISNAGFVVTDAGVVVLDALGTPSLAAKLRGLIREITDQPVVRVIMTHYHADHIYGLQVFKDEGAEVWAPAGALSYLESPQAAERLEERRFSLDPWVNDNTRLVPPDQIVAENTEFSLGGVTFRLSLLGKAHSDEDLTLFVVDDKVLYSGDIIFEGRVPYVGDANTKQWLAALTSMQTGGLKALVPGHGPAASNPEAAVAATRDYVGYLREVMGAAVEELQDFDSAYKAADWSRFEQLPAFDAANRRNAYQVYLSMEAEALGDD